MDRFEHKLGDKVIVEVPGEIVARHECKWGDTYTVRPASPKIQDMRVSVHAVFADDDAEVVSNVIAFPRPVDEVA